MSVLAFAHVGLTCKDPLAVERFYTQYFGFQRVRVVPLGEDQLVYTRSGNLTLEIFPAKEDRPVPPPSADGYPSPGVRHLAFQVDDVDAKLAELGEAAKITLGPLEFDAFIPGWKTVWIADPEGNIIEISQGYTDAPGTPPLPV
ncbi:MAG: VOC family protein [Candidatus Competibacter sp.]|nr:VOC family protein [Candidatus Contendobacter sp.]MDS4068368.1 VOC family protein [Candidatus Competibacter sp.]